MKKIVMFENINWKKSPKVREGLNREVVDDYSERYLRKEEMPAPMIAEVAINGEGPFLLAIDGMHRIHAMKKNGAKGCTCEVLTMTLDEAINRALGANREHGLRRSTADKRTCCISALLAWPEKSNLAIAKAVGVDDKTVNTVRKELEKLGKLNKETKRVDTKGREVAKPKTDDVRNSERAGAEEPEDATGFPLPKELRGIWEEADTTYDHLIHCLDTVVTNLEEAKREKDIVFAEVNFSALEGDLEKASTALRSLRPHAVCPICMGYPDLQDKSCKACKGRGFISKLLWEAVPPDVKRTRTKKATEAVSAN